MDNNTSQKMPLPCTAGCGFYGNEIYNNMCSKCFKANKTNEMKSSHDETPEKIPSAPNPIRTSLSPTPSVVKGSIPSPSSETMSRKHPRPSSPGLPETSEHTNPHPLPSAVNNNTNPSNEKPVQEKKGRCFKCRVKVPLGKQAANKCRCDYVFCDSHRYPDRHDCDIDFAQLDKNILAKNNPKLHERPKGGRSFQRIDSL